MARHRCGGTLAKMDGFTARSPTGIRREDLAEQRRNYPPFRAWSKRNSPKRNSQSWDSWCVRVKGWCGPADPECFGAGRAGLGAGMPPYAVARPENCLH